MKNKLIIAALLLSISCSSPKEEKVAESNGHEHHDHSAHAGTSNAKSPRTAAMANIGSNHVHIDYSAPSVRGRQIFGGLVAFDEVWVTGAHTATSIAFNKDLIIEGEKVPKGKYALFTIPGENSWTVILNKNYEQHLADDYDEADDVLRIKIETFTPEVQAEQLKFEVISKTSNSGVLRFSWDQTAFELDIEVE
ncbi:MAG: DUF2911 domain-containing protein [Mongoliibacter sp.]|uniref:DUF2911 domain-containing protein n=1 Tax=Mongoliibacter sp. TaxID=2022438 RepID=UPI0012F3B2B1|nr:DUF2911 domain-containing protein [Mongoliibacter sp.]TVP48395.1 MAG: DUF2911 domain-containing protein [Mongoliibacter sp.]